MNCEPYERGRFLVESESGQLPYLVDGLEYRRHGQCACDDFRIRIQKVWEDGETPAKTACKHLRRVFAFLGNLVQSLVSFRLTKQERQHAVTRIIFQLAAFEARCKLKATRYGVQN